MKNQVLLMLLFAFLCANINAQQARTASGGQAGITHLNDFLSTHATGSQARAAGHAPENLIKDNHPSVYVMAGEVKAYGNNPVKLFTDVSSMAAITSLNAAYDSSIQMVTIKLTSEQDLAAGIDLSVLSRFTNLKYVYILSEVTVDPQLLINSVQNSNPRYNVFYNIVKPS